MNHKSPHRATASTLERLLVLLGQSLEHWWPPAAFNRYLVDAAGRRRARVQAVGRSQPVPATRREEAGRSREYVVAQPGLERIRSAFGE